MASNLGYQWSRKLDDHIIYIYTYIHIYIYIYNHIQFLDPSPDRSIACLVPSWKTFLFVRLGVVLLAAGLEELPEQFSGDPGLPKKKRLPKLRSPRLFPGQEVIKRADLQCPLEIPRICNIAEKSMESKVPEILAPHGCSNVCCRCSAATLDLFSGGLSTSSRCTYLSLRLTVAQQSPAWTSAGELWVEVEAVHTTPLGNRTHTGSWLLTSQFMLLEGLRCTRRIEISHQNYFPASFKALMASSSVCVSSCTRKYR